jgi:hypothetical protein
VIKRLRGFFESAETAKRLRYRHNYKQVPGEVSDIFDGEHYQSLREKYVEIDGKVLNHKFFSDHRCIALGISTDGFQVS